MPEEIEVEPEEYSDAEMGAVSTCMAALHPFDPIDRMRILFLLANYTIEKVTTEKD